MLGKSGSRVIGFDVVVLGPKIVSHVVNTNLLLKCPDRVSQCLEGGWRVLLDVESGVF